VGDSYKAVNDTTSTLFAPSQLLDKCFSCAGFASGPKRNTSFHKAMGGSFEHLYVEVTTSPTQRMWLCQLPRL
jgi:hypothetical protein